MSKILDAKLEKMSAGELDLLKLRHTAEHILHTAMQNLYPEMKKAMGPSTSKGYYLDFDLGEKVSEEDFPKIEKEMKRLIGLNLKMVQEIISVDEAKKIFAENPYKMDWVHQIEERGEEVSIYKIVDKDGKVYDLDLCSGPHLDWVNKIKAFKLLSIAGAYWHGDVKNKMLTRIYGSAFKSKDELKKFIWQKEEAEKRDHRKIGRDLDLFVFSDLVGKGLPLFTPKGTLLRELLNEFSQGLRLKQGFQKVWIPHITKKDLYEVSGHWQKFGKELFLVKSQETTDEMVMKPMNCPHHQQIYAAKQHSYRDLPIKYMETTTIYRDEKAGELLGLSRVRSATQDDSHIFCTPEQIADVYQMLISITDEFFRKLKLSYRARLSFRDKNQPDKYLGEPKLWDKAQEILLNVAQANKLDYFLAEGEAAFYGPKIDYMITDALGREWQLATPQLDFVQPKRFGLSYLDQEGREQTPVMIHYALMGSIERFLSVYIEHTAGNFPVWLSPVQVELIPISERHVEYVNKIKNTLLENSIRIEVNEKSETMQAKIREATLQKIPYMGIIGDKEISQSSDRNNPEKMFISVRTREGKDLGQLNVKQLSEKLKEEIETKL